MNTLSEMRIPLFRDTEFVRRYQLYLIDRYLLSDDTQAVESPKEFLKALLTYIPDLVCEESRSAQKMVDMLLRSPDFHPHSDGRILGYKSDTLRRQYDAMKKDFFRDLLLLTPSQVRWFMFRGTPENDGY